MLFTVLEAGESKAERLAHVMSGRNQSVLPGWCLELSRGEKQKGKRRMSVFSGARFVKVFVISKGGGGLINSPNIQWLDATSIGIKFQHEVFERTRFHTMASALSQLSLIGQAVPRVFGDNLSSQNQSRQLTDFVAWIKE